MTLHDQTIAKIRQMPETLVQEVNDFVDFLLLKHTHSQSELMQSSIDSQSLIESGFSDYLSNLEDYEDRLARGEIQW